MFECPSPDPSTAHDEKKNVEMDAFILQDLTEAIK